MTIPDLLASAALIAAVLLAVSYWGVGFLIHPPAMSPMAVFPERFGARYEKVSFSAADGTRLAGWFLPSPRGEDKTLVICHGWGDNKGEILERTLFLNRERGFNLLYFDFRGHGESAPSIVTMGKLELLDLDAALRWLRESKPRCARRLGLYGLSMGAAVAAIALADHPEVRAAVLESPFADYRLVGARWAWSNYRVPYFPTVWLLMRWARARSGHWDIDAYSPEAFIARARTPVLLIAGGQDALMPPQDVRRVYERARGPRHFWVVPGAAHAKCRETAPAGYDAKVSAFLDLHLSDAPRVV